MSLQVLDIIFHPVWKISPHYLLSHCSLLPRWTGLATQWVSVGSFERSPNNKCTSWLLSCSEGGMWTDHVAPKYTHTHTHIRFGIGSRLLRKTTWTRVGQGHDSQLTESSAAVRTLVTLCLTWHCVCVCGLLFKSYSGSGNNGHPAIVQFTCPLFAFGV